MVMNIAFQTDIDAFSRINLKQSIRKLSNHKISHLRKKMFYSCDIFGQMPEKKTNIVIRRETSMFVAPTGSHILHDHEQHFLVASYLQTASEMKVKTAWTYMWVHRALSGILSIQSCNPVLHCFCILMDFT